MRLLSTLRPGLYAAVFAAVAPACSLVDAAVGDSADGAAEPTIDAASTVDAGTVDAPGFDATVADGAPSDAAVVDAMPVADAPVDAAPVPDAPTPDALIPGVITVMTSGTVTSEMGDAVMITVTLDRAPSSNVAVSVVSEDDDEVTASPPALVFAPSDWTPRVVTARGVDDDVDDGDVEVTIELGAAVSVDPHYDGVDPEDVTVTNTDNDTVGLSVVPRTGLVTDEDGTTDTFTIALNTEPTAPVNIALASMDEDEVMVSADTIQLDATNWFMPRTITVTGVDDGVSDGNPVVTIQLGPVTSSDPLYDEIAAGTVTVTNVNVD